MLSRISGWLKENYIFVFVLIVAFALRAYNLESAPAGFYMDEAISGYDAYSILQTGKDSNGDFMPLFFRAADDWRDPIHIYFLIPFVALFGNTVAAVRMSVVVLSVISILFTYLFVKKIFSKNTAVFSSIILSTMPWHFMFSRVGFVGMSGIALLSISLYTFAMSLENKKYLPLSMGLFALNFYSYGIFRIISPLLLASLLFLHWKKFSVSKELKVGAVACLIIILPFIIYSFEHPDRANFRFEQISIFNKEALNFEKGYADYAPLSFLGDFGIQFSTLIKNYLAHISPQFLFFSGDGNLRHMVSGFGELLLSTAVLVAVGAFILLKENNWKTKFLAFWLAIFPLTAALTIDGIPHSTRTMDVAMLFSIIAGVGAGYIFYKSKSGGLFAIIFIFVAAAFLIDSAAFLNHYYFEYPKYSYSAFETNVGEAITYVKSVGASGDIILSYPCCGRANFYIAYFTAFPPGKFQKGKYADNPYSQQTQERLIYTNVSAYCEQNSTMPHTLIVKSADAYYNSTKSVKKIFNPDGTESFAIGSCQ